MTGDALLYSQRGAARILGVSPDLIAELRRTGVLRSVPWPCRAGFRFPLVELQRLAREGVSPGGRAMRPSRRQVRATNPVAGILAIRVDP
jgi:hypothetical protein